MNTIKKIQVDGVDYDIQANELTKVTYAELKEMRDNGSLVAGHLYRITDYEFTTKQSNTKSAGHLFDVIVLATTEDQLSELARAIQHEGDTYFDGNDLCAWELWYDLDNDTNKYEWADVTNGKGVIYRMIDEKCNDCPYDFKNALFYNDKLTNYPTSDKYYYTFSYVVSIRLYDGTVEKQVKNCYNNSMGVYLKSNKKSLNFNVFRNNVFSNSCNENKFEYNCYNNKFDGYCSNNTFGSNCYNNRFESVCNENKFGNSCHTNTFDYYCSNNTFGSNCYNNRLEYNCNYNKFVDNCSNNALRKNCSNNTFGSNVRENVLNTNNTSITLNDEYYDDGSGQLVPIKHPDLSTQPSILPYKFMGQYVYEQLIPMTFVSASTSQISVMCGDQVLGKELANMYRNNAILEQAILIKFNKNIQETNDLPQLIAYPASSSMNPDGYVDFIWEGFIDSRIKKDIISTVYVRIVYTSMPKEEDYYGYNNY